MHPYGRMIKYLKAMSGDARYDVRSIDVPALGLQVITRSVWVYALVARTLTGNVMVFVSRCMPKVDI